MMTPEEFASIVADAVQFALEPLFARVAALEREPSSAITMLEQRITALEAKPTATYRGVWKSERSYSPGDLTTHGGSLWACEATTAARPGNGASGWLAVKKGDA